MKSVLKNMENGLSSLSQEPDLQLLSMHERSEHFGQAMSGNAAVHLSFQSEEEGDFNLEMETFDAVLMYKTNLQPRQSAFQIPLYREEPTLTLMFQETGHSVFKKHNLIELAPHRHSIHFLPNFDSNFLIQKGHHVENRIIKLKLNYFEKYVHTNQHIGGWVYDEMQKNKVIGSAQQGLPLSPEIRTILHQIDHCPYDDVLKELYVDGLIKMLLTHQLHAYNQLVLNKKSAWNDKKLSRQDVQKLQELRFYLDQNYLISLSLNDLAKHFTLNEFKLKYGFKKLFGTSVMHYVYEKRLHYSKSLLLETDKTIFEIAHIVGYHHSNNFCASFKKRFGFSPTGFRTNS